VHTTLVGLIGDPVAESLSPRMQNAAFAAAGLEWTYVLLPTRADALAQAVSGLAELGFAGANVTTPHKLAVRALCRTDAASVNTLVVMEDGVDGYSTDAAILAGLVAERPVIVGGGGAAEAFREALPQATVFSRREKWPPEVADADLVVNATSERDEVLFEVGSGQTLVDLPYPETATARSARVRGATVVDGLDVLVAQGAAAFERWTGVQAPLDVMQRAVRSSA
jgi:shikimate dehydrogenase